MIVIVAGGAIIVAALAINGLRALRAAYQAYEDRYPWPLESDGLSDWQRSLLESQGFDIPDWVNHGDDWGQWEDELT